jgi:hypothetical protein
MGKPRNPVQSEKLLITTTPQVRLYLEELAAGGLYGKNANEAAERLLAGAIEERIREGTIKRVVFRKERHVVGREVGTSNDPSRS